MKSKSPVPWIVVIALCFFALGYLSSLFVTGSGTDQAPSYVERLDAALGLSDEQETKISSLLDDEDRQISAIIDKVREPVVGEIQKVRGDTAEKIRALLDESQRKRFDEGGFSSDTDF